jgi:class 3 adenylate cyclase
VNCSNCGTTNEAGRKFCKECGAALAIACPNCGAANAADSKFCGECGTALGLVAPSAAAAPGQPAQPAQAAQPAPTAERRLVSVLFADLVGFTTIAQGRDAEETRELLSRYFALSRDIIERHGGTVEKFIGDAVMAVWGAPVAQEDDAERAVRAALALVDGVRSLGPGIAARAGVLTGEAAVTVGAVGEGMVAGDLVNTASRLQSVAPPGAVFVGEATQRAASSAIAFEAVGPQALKGKEAPVPAYRAMRVVAELGGRNRTEALEAPFVGRDDEFRLLKDLFHSTGRDRRPRLISVLGPAGIGKSRLAWEFLKYVDGLVEDTYWHAGRSPSYGEGISFWALGEMVRRRAGLLESDDEATTREKLLEMTRRWVPDENERRWIETALLALLGLGDPLPGGRDELFAAWRTFFERIAETATTVLLFEDLQWADVGVLDFIDHLLDWTKALPIFVVTLSRPELLERRPDWGAGRRNFVSLALDPLSEEAMRQLLDGLVPGLPVPIVRQIVGRADGIPLYAVETVRMLVAEGRLRQTPDGAYAPVGTVDAIAIPETLTALIAARLDALDAQGRALLQQAAVLGQSFSADSLAAIAAVDADRIRPVLSDLVSRELLTVERDPRSPERGQYAFVQALIREVAYNQLARAERKSRHLAAARWFESLGDQELSGVLAEHYAAAFRSAPAGAEADALAGQARIALRAAADRAAKLGSHGHAVGYLKQALEITVEPAERAAVLERLGREASDATPEMALGYHQQALAAYRELGDLRGAARAASGASIVLNAVSRPGEAIPLLEGLADEVADREPEPDFVRMLAELTRVYANTGHPKALETADRVLGLVEQMNEIELIAEALINRSLVLGYGGRYQESTALLRGVLPLTETHDLVWPRVRALNNLASQLQDDDMRAAQRFVVEGMDLARRTGSLGTLRYFQASYVANQFDFGEWEAAQPLVDELEEELRNDPAAGWALDYLYAAVLFEAYRGHHDLAAEAIADIRRRMASVSHKEYVTARAWVEAQVAALAGRLDEAQRHVFGTSSDLTSHSARLAAWGARVSLWKGDLEHARQAVAELGGDTRPLRIGLVLGHEVRAAAHALAGEREQALAEYVEAIAGWRALDVPVSLGLCLTDLAIALGPTEPQAVEAADEARALWTRLGATPLLVRLEAAMASREPPASTSEEDRLEPAAERSAAG